MVSPSPISDYAYALEDCDVPEVRRESLAEYRKFRRECIEIMRGPARNSVMNQLHNLAWHTAIFRTLNESRRLTPHRPVNGAVWELVSSGYASLMTIGIRKLVDKHAKANSLANVIGRLQKRPELLTREKFICYDGLPYDYIVTRARFHDSIDRRADAILRRVPTDGPDAWGTSERMHVAFDDLADVDAQQRKRTDMISPALLLELQSKLDTPAINKVHTFVDRVVVHAERAAQGVETTPIVTYQDVDDALRDIARVADYVSGYLLFDVAFASLVPTPQYDVLEGMDLGWLKPDQLPALQKFWQESCDQMNAWIAPPPIIEGRRARADRAMWEEELAASARAAGNEP